MDVESDGRLTAKGEARVGGVFSKRGVSGSWGCG